MDETRAYLTSEELEILWRPMSADEETRAELYIPIVTSELRMKARAVGKDLDQMAENADYAAVLKSVLADIVGRVLNTSTRAEPMSQFAQSAGGYSASGTFLVPGGGLFIKKTELARLGLKRQTVGGIDVFDI